MRIVAPTGDTASALSAEARAPLGFEEHTTGVAMAEKASIWQRIVRWFRPERETYDTRRTRPDDPGDRPNDQFNEPTDQRRAGWSGW